MRKNSPLYTLDQDFCDTLSLKKQWTMLNKEENGMAQDDGIADAYVYRGNDPLVEYELGFHAVSAYVTRQNNMTGKSETELVCIHLYHPDDMHLKEKYGPENFELYGVINNHFRDVLGLYTPDEDFLPKSPFGQLKRVLHGKLWLTQDRLNTKAKNREDHFYTLDYFKEETRIVFQKQKTILSHELETRKKPSLMFPYLN